MNETVEVLLKLQDVDLKILRLERNLEKSPKALAETQNEVRNGKARLEEKLNAAKQLQVGIALQEEELLEHEQRMEKLRQQQFQRGIDNRAYQALSYEIEGEKANASNLQDTILKRYEEVEGLKQEAEALQTELEAAEAALREKEAEVEKELGELRDKIAAATEKRKEYAGQVDPAIVSSYERILRSKRDSAIVEVTANVCQGCYMALTPQMSLNLRKGSDIVNCQSCSRLLYLP